MIGFSYIEKLIGGRRGRAGKSIYLSFEEDETTDCRRVVVFVLSVSPLLAADERQQVVDRVLLRRRSRLIFKVYVLTIRRIFEDDAQTTRLKKVAPVSTNEDDLALSLTKSIDHDHVLHEDDPLNKRNKS